VLLCVLWMRSYIRVDKIWRPALPNDGWTAWTFRGQVFVRVGGGMGGPYKLQWALSRGGDAAPVYRFNSKFGFSFGPQYYSMPFWFPAFLSAVVSCTPWLLCSIPWSRRFSLRTFLIATTLIAVGLGLIVWAAK
jgi:hypothetical protein